MKLYILGNGFDIAHGFKTKYQDFRNYLIEKNRDDILYLFSDEELWSDFEYNLCALDYESYGWIVKEFKSDSEFVFEEVFNDICKEMANFLNQIDYNVSPICYLDKDSLFFVFNYTHTLEMLYEINSNNIYQPHGSIAEYLNFNKKLILGHHKHDFLVNPNLTGPKYFNSYENFSNYTEKPIEQIINSKEMKRFITKLEENNIDEVVFFGFSYSVVDMDYIEKIKEVLHKDTLYTMAYYSDEDKEHAEEFAQKLSLYNYKIEKNDLILKKIGSA